MDRYVLVVAFVMLVVSTTAAQLAASSHPRLVGAAHERVAQALARVNGALLPEAYLHLTRSPNYLSSAPRKCATPLLAIPQDTRFRGKSQSRPSPLSYPTTRPRSRN